MQIFARSAIVEKADRDTWADTAYYTVPSGAGVFSSGTIGWISTLTPNISGAPREPQLYHATMNMLRVFGAGPAGTTHPSIPNSGSTHASPLPPRPKPKPKPIYVPPTAPPTAPPDPGIIPPVTP